MRISGVSINYYVHCIRECWLYVHRIECDQEYELVKIGKYLHEQRESKTKKIDTAELSIDSIKLDSIEGDYVVEYKKKNSSEEASRAQLLYYLYVLKQKGIIKKGLLKFKETRKNIEIELTPENEQYIENLIASTEGLIRQDQIPPTINKPKCKKCAYYDYCYS